MTVCKHAYYSGRVQGVGFRFTAQHVAEGFAVAGFVRNQPDGTVEVLAEGPAEQMVGSGRLNCANSIKVIGDHFLKRPG